MVVNLNFDTNYSIEHTNFANLNTNFANLNTNFVNLNTKIEHSIVLEGTHLNDLTNRVINSLIGKNVRIYQEPVKPSAYRFMLGDNSEVGIR